MRHSLRALVRSFALRLLFFSLPGLVLAAAAPSPAPGTAATDWERLVALDAGPATKFKTTTEAREGAIAHLAAQERALRHFLAAYPDDEHIFEAKLRLARLLQIKSGFQGVAGAQIEARQILDDLNASATGAQRPEVDFARLTYAMRTMREGDAEEREDLLRSTLRFKTDFPSDRRLPALLAEVATLFDREPDTQRSLVQDALSFASEPGLRARLADDLKRLDLLGKVVPLRSPIGQGKFLDLADYRGKVVVLIFFGEFSPPSTEAVATLQRAAASWPKERVQMLGISLDSKADNLAALMRQMSIGWPVLFDGKGWNSPLVRGFGINRLPTVWLIDREGKLRSLNGLQGAVDQVRELLEES